MRALNRTNVVEARTIVVIGVALALVGWATPARAGAPVVVSSNADQLRYEAPIGHRQPRQRDLPQRVQQEAEQMTIDQENRSLDKG